MMMREQRAKQFMPFDAMKGLAEALRDREECYRFFEDLCSPRELSSMEQRYEVARLLMQDNVYTKILEITGASSATISRVRRNILDDRGAGALKAIVERRQAEEE